ncbi:arylamine N-acetyltransferase [candidate division KSB1 bacterium]|nr:arylamine N-acetyltransferase [candidate division KSB1 bacterium]
MQNSQKKSLILNPHDQATAVFQFMDFFRLKQKSPSSDFLEVILTAFSNLPYENISKILNLQHDFLSSDHIRLPERIIDEHALYNFGGTCFSLTFFLQSILSQHGFNCYPVMADMRHRSNIHCALIVVMGLKKYLVDPGYLLNHPMEIHPDKPRLYYSEHNGIELQFEKQVDIYHLYTFDRHQKKWRYRFCDKPTPPDQFLRYWLDSFYKAPMHSICLVKIQGNGLLYMHNDYLQITTIEGRQKRHVKDNIHTTVHEVFGIAPEQVEMALAAIEENKKLERKHNLYIPKLKEVINEAR